MCKCFNGNKNNFIVIVIVIVMLPVKMPDVFEYNVNTESWAVL